MLRDVVRKSGGGGTTFNQTIDGILLFLDTARSKWLSTSRESFLFGINHKSITTERYMLIGEVVASATGIRIPRNATITSISVQTKNTTTGSFKIRRNDSGVDLATLSLNLEQGKSQSNISIDINKDDWIQVLISPVSAVDYPILNLELAWRT